MTDSATNHTNTVASAGQRIRERLRSALKPAWLLLAATVATQVRWPLHWDRFAISHAVVALGAATMLAHAAAHSRPRSAATLLAAGLVAWLVETVGVATGWPFGRYRYADQVTYTMCPSTRLCSQVAEATHAAITLAGVPVIVLLAWFMMGYATHIAARRLARAPWARWAWATWMLAAWDLYLDPQFILDPHLRQGWWLWSDPSPHLPGVPGIPLTNYLGWLVAAAGIQAVLHLTAPPAGAVEDRGWDPPTVFVLWTWIGGAVAVAWFVEQPAAAAWGALAGAPAGLLLIRNRLQAPRLGRGGHDHPVPQPRRGR